MSADRRHQPHASFLSQEPTTPPQPRRRRDYRSSDDEDEDEEMGRQRGPAARRLVITYPRSPSSHSSPPGAAGHADEDSISDSDEDNGRQGDDRFEEGRVQHSPHALVTHQHQQPHDHHGSQPRLSILNHTSHAHNLHHHQQAHNSHSNSHQSHHPHILSNPSSASSSRSGSNSHINQLPHPSHNPSPGASAPDAGRTSSSGTHVIIGSSLGSSRTLENSMYISKGENGHPVTYRVVPVSDLHYQQENHAGSPASPSVQSCNSDHCHPHVNHCDPGVISSAHQHHHAPAIVNGAAAPAPGHFLASHHMENGVQGPGFYVMMTESPENSPLPVHGMPAPRKKSNSINVADLSAAGPSNRASRDERRRATHNEVERRRRDKINNWITRLAKLVPNCTQDHTKQGQSKGGILAKTCDHISDLEKQVTHFKELARDREILATEVLSLREQLEAANRENRRLCSILNRRGLDEDLN